MRTDLLPYLAEIVGPVMAVAAALAAALCIFANEYFKGGEQPTDTESDDG